MVRMVTFSDEFPMLGCKTGRKGNVGVEEEEEERGGGRGSSGLSSSQGQEKLPGVQPLHPTLLCHCQPTYLQNHTPDHLNENLELLTDRGKTIHLVYLFSTTTNKTSHLTDYLYTCKHTCLPNYPCIYLISKPGPN